MNPTPPPEIPSTQPSSFVPSPPQHSYPPAPPGPVPGAPSFAQPRYGQFAGPGVATDQRPTNAAVIVIAWILAVVTLGYFIPWAVAASRGKSNQGAVALINLFLGWTLIGWIVAFVMACTAHQIVAVSQPVFVAQHFAAAPAASVPPAGWYPAPDRVGQQYWDGGAWTAHRSP